MLTAEQRIGDPEGYRNYPLHTESDGSFSIGSSARRYYDHPVMPV